MDGSRMRPLAVVLGVCASASLGWAAYMSQEVVRNREQFARIDARLATIERRLDQMATSQEIDQALAALRDALANASHPGYNEGKRPQGRP